MILTIVALVLLWFTVHACFVAVMAAKELAERDLLTTYWYVMLLPVAVVGLILDLVFSLTFGWVMFLERPRAELFTSKLKRHKEDFEWRGDLAAWFCTNLNLFDPGHC